MKKPWNHVAGVDKKKGPKGEFLVGVAEEDVTIPAGASVMVFSNKRNPPPYYNVVWQSGAPAPPADDEFPF